MTRFAFRKSAPGTCPSRNAVPWKCSALLSAALLASGVLSVLALAPQAFAQTRTFDLTYSGAPFNNSAMGMGTITLDLSKINNPGTTTQRISPFVKDFSLTVSGASSGNGTFTFTDYNGSPTVGGFLLFTNGGTLDFSRELFGQPTGASPFGTPGGTGGDFNLSSNRTNPAAPEGTNYFRITTANGRGDNLYLTSFRPAAVTAAAVPEPSEYAVGGMFGATLLFGMVKARRKSTSKKSPATA